MGASQYWSLQSIDAGETAIARERELASGSRGPDLVPLSTQSCKLTLLQRCYIPLQIGDITYISGQIALVPGSMTIIEGGIRPQCKLTLRHISRIAKAMNAQGQLRDVVHGICFVTHPAFIGEARRQWERRTTNAIMDYIVLPALPRDALVEWQVWAHTHNDRFDCKPRQIHFMYMNPVPPCVPL